MTIDTHLLKHERCPACAKLGNDTKGDNLGIYSDGHHWCYACGYFVPGSAITGYIARTSTDDTRVNIQTSKLSLPTDSSRAIPREAKEWFFQYGFDHNTLLRNNIMWSAQREMLIFPYFIMGELMGWQGRVFNPEERTKRKWFTQGKVDDFIYTVGRPEKQLVLVESIVSAIKVGRVTEASPIFGSNISMQRLLRLSKMYDKIIIWLDPDKRKEAINSARKAALFALETHVVFSEDKPKDHTIEEIERYLNEHSISNS